MSQKQRRDTSKLGMVLLTFNPSAQGTEAGKSQKGGRKEGSEAGRKEGGREGRREGQFTKLCASVFLI